MQWTEVPESKLSVVKARINRVIDMLRMGFAYMCGQWTVNAAKYY